MEGRQTASGPARVRSNPHSGPPGRCRRRPDRRAPRRWRPGPRTRPTATPPARGWRRPGFGPHPIDDPPAHLGGIGGHQGGDRSIRIHPLAPGSHRHHRGGLGDRGGQIGSDDLRDPGCPQPQDELGTVGSAEGVGAEEAVGRGDHRRSRAAKAGSGVGQHRPPDRGGGRGRRHRVAAVGAGDDDSPSTGPAGVDDVGHCGRRRGRRRLLHPVPRLAVGPSGLDVQGRGVSEEGLPKRQVQMDRAGPGRTGDRLGHRPGGQRPPGRRTRGFGHARDRRTSAPTRRTDAVGRSSAGPRCPGAQGVGRRCRSAGAHWPGRPPPPRHGARRRRCHWWSPSPPGARGPGRYRGR